MESRERLREYIARAEPDRRGYLTQMFQDLPEDALAELRYREVRRGEYILQAGAPSDTVHIVLSGRMAGLDYQTMGRVYDFMDFTRMYIVGDFEVFGGFCECCVSIRAVQSCCLLEMSSESYLRWIRNDGGALFLRLQNIMTILTSERITDRASIFMNCRERLVRFLVNSYETGQPDGEGTYKVEKTQAELADRIGFHTRSVQRSIAALKEEGFLCLERGKITLNPEQYRALKQYKKEEKRFAKP